VLTGIADHGALRAAAHLPSDYALTPVVPVEVKPIAFRSHAPALEKAMAIIADRINSAKSVVAFPAYTILRLGLQKQTQAAVEALGCAFVTTLMEKCVIDEGHPHSPACMWAPCPIHRLQQALEGADFVLDLGGVNLNDITTASYSGRLDLSRFITVGLNDVRIGEDVIAGVRLEDVLTELAKLKPLLTPYRARPQRSPPVSGNPSDGLRWLRSIPAMHRSCARETRSSARPEARAWA
jgi:indolepyruvate decarboxylase